MLDLAISLLLLDIAEGVCSLIMAVSVVLGHAILILAGCNNTFGCVIRRVGIDGGISDDASGCV